MLGDPDRPYARSPTAMRNAERLVQIEVAHVCTEFAGLRQPEQGIEVGTVDVNLAAGACTISQSLVMPSSKTPWVDG